MLSSFDTAVDVLFPLTGGITTGFEFLLVFCRRISHFRFEYHRKIVLTGKGKLKTIDSNLENSRWMNKEERNKV